MLKRAVVKRFLKLQNKKKPPLHDAVKAVLKKRLLQLQFETDTNAYTKATTAT